MNQRTLNVLTALGLVLIGAGLRLLPHPANFAPITAVALFGGAVLPRRLGLWVPLLAMMASDAIIGFHKLIPLTWGCYALSALAASYYLKKKSFGRVAGLTLASSLFFFLVTNFGVWLTSGMYTHTLAGLQRCFVLALPFFRNSLLSDLLYTGAFFAAYAMSIQYSHKFVKTQSSALI